MLASKKESHVDGEMCAGVGRGETGHVEREEGSKKAAVRHCHRGRCTNGSKHHSEHSLVTEVQEKKSTEFILAVV